MRRRLRNARAASDSGVPVAVDWTTQLATVPYEGRFPPPLAQCTVVEPCEYRTRLHPLSVNSTTTEKMHYVDHTVHAPAMTLEHLVDQYWFPALGLLISEKGQVWRHSFLGPFQEGFLSSIKAIVDRHAAGRRARASAASRAADPRAANRAASILLIAGSDKPNFGHFMLDIVPLIHLGATMGMPMLSWTLRPWQRALIARLDVPPGLIREIRPRPVFLDHAIVSNRLSGVGCQNAHPQHKRAFARILANVRKDAPALNTPARVLVCRGLTNSRNVTNRAAMIEALKAARLRCDPAGNAARSMSRFSLFAQAEIIVCEFGAAMANAMFCRPGTRVVEIIAEGQHDPWSSHLFAMLELEHIVLFQPQSEADLGNRAPAREGLARLPTRSMCRGWWRR